MSNSVPFELTLYDNCLVSPDSPLMRVTNQIGRTWRRSKRSIGGPWMGEAEFDGSISEMDDIFRDGLTWEIRETWGGYLTWQGFLAGMEYTRNGVTYTKNWANMANRMKLKYKQTTPQLITNTSVETDPWTEFGTPTTFERTTEWKTHGEYSMHIITDELGEGCIVATEIEISAGTEYRFSLDYHIVRGYWRVFIMTEEEEPRFIGFSSQNTIATNNEGTFVGTIASDHYYEYSGNVRMICQDITSVRGSNDIEIYIDNASFRGGVDNATTSWTDDLDSQGVYGVIEDIFSREKLTEEAANATVSSEMRKRAFPLVQPPTSWSLDAENKDNKLELIFYGYVFTLKNKYSLLSTLYGEEEATTCTTVVQDEIASAEFVSAGEIETNDTAFYSESIDEDNRQWHTFELIADTGDGDGSRWEIGVDPGRRLYYRKVTEETKGRIRKGLLYDSVGGLVHPWLAEPGYYLIEDMPVDYQHMSGYLSRNARVVYIDEVEFDSGNYMNGGSGLRFYRNQ